MDRQNNASFVCPFVILCFTYVVCLFICYFMFHLCCFVCPFAILCLTYVVLTVHLLFYVSLTLYNNKWTDKTTEVKDKITNGQTKQRKWNKKQMDRQSNGSETYNNKWRYKATEVKHKITNGQTKQRKWNIKCPFVILCFTCIVLPVHLLFYVLLTLFCLSICYCMFHLRCEVKHKKTIGQTKQRKWNITSQMDRQNNTSEA
jgi:Flp pilus assembly protein TadB